MKDIQIIKDARTEQERNCYASGYLQIIMDNSDDAALAVALAQNNYRKHIVDTSKRDNAVIIIFDDASMLRAERKDGRQHFMMAWLPDDMRASLAEYKRGRAA